MDWHRSGRWWPLVIGIALLLLWTARPIGVSAPASIDTPFDEERAIARLATILGDERPHPTDSDANDAVEARLLAEIREAGFEPVVNERFHCNDIREGAAICARPRNIAFWVTPPGDDAVMVAAHYDSVPSGPGAADDGIGVAVALEIACQLKDRKLERPLLILLTDAEEAGLVGAAAFAAHDPLAKRVRTIVNMEARGTTGGVNMFQTSSPNGRDVAAIEKGPLPSANSLASDFYELLPNDTDLTMWLPLGVDAGNYSIIGSGKRYHTPLDRLAYLDPASVRHMGATALAAVTGHAVERRSDGAEASLVYTDIARRLLLVMPQMLAGIVLVAGLAASLFLFWRAAGAGRARAAAAPIVALVAGTAIAAGAGFLVAAIRPETAYGTAYPWVFRLLYAAAALAGAALVLGLMSEENRLRGGAGAWAWLAIFILAGFVFVPGLAILAAWPLLFLIAVAVVSRFPRISGASRPLLFGAAALFLLIVLPLAGGLEEGLFIEQAAPTSALLVFMFLFFLPGGGRAVRLASAAFGLVAAAAFVAALLVPAFALDAPRHLTIVHEDDNGKSTWQIEDNGPLPDTLRSAASFGDRPDDKGLWRAAAPSIASDGGIEIMSDSLSGGRRIMRFAAVSPLSDRQELLIKDGSAIRRVTVNGARPAVKGVPTYIGCTGRSCRRLEVELELVGRAKLPVIDWRRTRYGAGAAAARLVASRPATAQPVHVGDRQVLIRRLRLPAKPAAR